MQKIGTIIDPKSILVVCDMIGVSSRGYKEIFRTVHKLIYLVDNKFKVVILPRPYKVRIPITFITHTIIYLFVTKFQDAGKIVLLEQTMGVVFTSRREENLHVCETCIANILKLQILTDCGILKEL